MRFRCLIGQHVQAVPGSKPNAQGRRPIQTVRQGEVFESEHDVARQFNHGNVARKFERVLDDTPLGMPPEPESVYSIADLNSLSLNELQKLAADWEIDLKGATKKEDVVKTLYSNQVPKT